MCNDNNPWQHKALEKMQSPQCVCVLPSKISNNGTTKTITLATNTVYLLFMFSL